MSDLDIYIKKYKEAQLARDKAFANIPKGAPFYEMAPKQWDEYNMCLNQVYDIALLIANIVADETSKV